LPTRKAALKIRAIVARYFGGVSDMNRVLFIAALLAGFLTAMAFAQTHGALDVMLRG